MNFLDLQGTTQYPDCAGCHGNLVSRQQVQHWRRPHGDTEGVHEVSERLHQGEMWLCAPLLVSRNVFEEFFLCMCCCSTVFITPPPPHFKMHFLFLSFRGNRFHSSWGGASYMGGVCSLTKGGGVNEVGLQPHIQPLYHLLDRECSEQYSKF